MSWWNDVQETGLYNQVINKGELPGGTYAMEVTDSTIYKLAAMIMAVLIVAIILNRLVKTL
jgi:hypothetical protein